MFVVTDAIAYWWAFVVRSIVPLKKRYECLRTEAVALVTIIVILFIYSWFVFFTSFQRYKLMEDLYLTL